MNDARRFAEERHGSQRYGNDPYVVHLDAVASLVRDYGDTAVTVAYLHDIVEDTCTTVSEIRAAYGDLVADCVALLTDPPGKNRKERKAELHDRLAAVTGELKLALIIKTADRLANLQACVDNRNASLLEMYRREYPAFRRAAYRAGQCEELWNRISALLVQGEG